jgi:hypothetical protein
MSCPSLQCLVLKLGIEPRKDDYLPSGVYKMKYKTVSTSCVIGKVLSWPRFAEQKLAIMSSRRTLVQLLYSPVLSVVMLRALGHAAVAAAWSPQATAN